jgi:thiol-disulfide isomerase/thioredoxin
VLPIVFVVLAILLAAAVAFSSGGSQSDEDRIADTAGAPIVSGESLIPFTDNPIDAAIGAAAPTVTGTDYQGRTVTIEHDGTPKAVVFLAHWCSHCQAEVPRVQAWLEETGGVPGVDIISVSTAYRPAQGNWSPEEWLNEEGWTTPLIRDDSDSSAYVSYGGGPFPYWVLLKGDGTVALRTAGEMGTDALAQLLQGLVGG